MFKNYVIIALRSLWKNKLFSAINIAGLSAGLACCILMFLFIRNELNYDKFNLHAGSIYRVTSSGTGAEDKDLSVTPAPWAPLMQKDYPEVKEYVRLLKDEKSLVGEPGKEHHYEKDMLFSDASFFKVFSFNLINGDANRVLDAPNSIVITKEMATKYFGNANPIGKVLEVTTTSPGRTFSLTVTGVANEAPGNSHFKFSGLISMQSLGDISGFWSFHMFSTYLFLADGTSKAAMEAKFKQFGEKYINHNAQADGKRNIQLQSLTDIHLHSQMIGEIGVNGNIAYVYFFTGVAFFILLIACFNFMNLSTVRSLQRAKEVGLRKVAGAGRGQLIRQFLGESVLVSFIALTLAILFTFSALPLFNRLADRQLSFSLSHDRYLIELLVALIFFVGIVSGIYPALVLSSFKPVEVLKGKFQKGLKGAAFRKALVSFQFIICIALIAITIIIYQQLQYIQTKQLGFNKSQVLVVSLPKNTGAEKLETFKASLLNQHGVVSAGCTSILPGPKINVNQVHTENMPAGAANSVQMLFVDEDFVKTMQMKIIAGRDFSKSYSADMYESFIINQEAVKQAGWKTSADAIGKKIEWVIPGNVIKSGVITGVAEDFNITPLRTGVQPLVMHILPARLQYVYVRYNNLTAAGAVDAIGKAYKKVYTVQPYEYSFLDDSLNAMYAGEVKLGKIFRWFSALAIMIGCLGILGLSIYSVQQRTKEIGVRKVLGAGVGSIVVEIAKEFLKPVVMASVAAAPVAWWATSKWLQDFAYRVTISWWVFAVAGLTVLSIALATAGVQAVKAAMVNPVKSLRSE